MLVYFIEYKKKKTEKKSSGSLPKQNGSMNYWGKKDLINLYLYLFTTTC